ncbi:MAG: aldose epimerase, partial [Acetobacteraceae bacterium]|nr:aldose epimerase [Acetobacteraceae bacterium]
MSDALELAAGDWRATLLPRQGAAMARLTWRGRDILAPLPAGADPNATPAGAFLMAPWANRLDQGRLPVGSAVHHVPVNRPADATAIHGLLRDRAWRVEQAGRDAATLAAVLDAPAQPFRLAARPQVALDAA